MGNIEFNYGSAMSGLARDDWPIRGRQPHYTLSSLDGAATIAAAATSLHGFPADRDVAESGRRAERHADAARHLHFPGKPADSASPPNTGYRVGPARRRHAAALDSRRPRQRHGRAVRHRRGPPASRQPSCFPFDRQPFQQRDGRCDGAPTATIQPHQTLRPFRSRSPKRAWTESIIDDRGRGDGLRLRRRHDHHPRQPNGAP